MLIKLGVVVELTEFLLIRFVDLNLLQGHAHCSARHIWKGLLKRLSCEIEPDFMWLLNADHPDSAFWLACKLWALCNDQC